NQATHEIPRQFLDCAKARKRLSWKPRRSLEDGLRETIAWYRAALGSESGTPPNHSRRDDGARDAAGEWSGGEPDSYCVGYVLSTHAFHSASKTSGVKPKCRCSASRDDIFWRKSAHIDPNLTGSFCSR